jgi:hypothetical protein
MPNHPSQTPENALQNKRQGYAYAEYKPSLFINHILETSRGTLGRSTLLCAVLALHMLNICSKLTCWCLALPTLAGTTTWYKLSICTAYPQVNYLPADGVGGESSSSSSSGNGGGSGPR